MYPAHVGEDYAALTMPPILPIGLLDAFDDGAEVLFGHPEGEEGNV